VNIKEGLGRDVTSLYVTATSPGIVYRDLLILGSTVAEGPGPVAPGHLRAYNIRTGEMAWIFHTIPHPGEVGYETWPPDAWKFIGGANCWPGSTLDEKRGIVLCPWVRRRLISGAEIASARNFSPTASSPLTPPPANASGITNSSITTCGTATRPRRPPC